MKEEILKIVSSHNGIKSVELAMNIMSIINPLVFETEEFHNALSDLISSGEIIELEYIDPDIDYRIKSIYFKKGTKFMNLRGDNAAGLVR